MALDFEKRQYARLDFNLSSSEEQENAYFGGQEERFVQDDTSIVLIRM